MAKKNKKEITLGVSLQKLIDEKVVMIPTGSTELDDALGGGIGQGRIVNIIGMESTAKTLLALEIAHKFQVMFIKGIVVFDDAENALDYKWAVRTFRLDPKRFFVRNSETVEELQGALEVACRKSTPDVPILYIHDSLDAVSTLRELEEAADVSNMRTNVDKSIVTSRMFRKTVAKIKRAQLTLIVISQVRKKIGIMFGDPDGISGGNALKFYCTQRIKMAEIRQIKFDIKKGKIKRKGSLGVDIRARVIKNKLAPPFKEAEFPIYFKRGIDDVEGCIRFLKNTGSFGKSYKLGKKSFKGFSKFYKHVMKKGERIVKLRNMVRKELKQMYIDGEGD